MPFSPLAGLCFVWYLIRSQKLSSNTVVSYIYQIVQTCYLIGLNCKFEGPGVRCAYYLWRLYSKLSLSHTHSHAHTTCASTQICTTHTHTHAVDSGHMVCVAISGVKFNIVKNAWCSAAPPPLYSKGFEVYRPAAPFPLCCRVTQGDYVRPAASVQTLGKVPIHNLVYLMKMTAGSCDIFQ